MSKVKVCPACKGYDEPITMFTVTTCEVTGFFDFNSGNFSSDDYAAGEPLIGKDTLCRCNGCNHHFRYHQLVEIEVDDVVTENDDCNGRTERYIVEL